MRILRKALIAALVGAAVAACGGGLETRPAPGPTTDALVGSLAVDPGRVIQELFDLRSTAYCEGSQALVHQVDAAGSKAEEEDRFNIRRGSPCDRIFVKEAVFYSADPQECRYFFVPSWETTSCAAFATRLTGSAGVDLFRKVVLTCDVPQARWLFAGVVEHPPPPK